MSDERVADKKQEEDAEMAEKFEIYKVAYVENLNGSYLFQSMYKDDAEGIKLKGLPGVEEMLSQYPFYLIISLLQAFMRDVFISKTRGEGLLRLCAIFCFSFACLYK